MYTSKKICMYIVKCMHAYSMHAYYLNTYIIFKCAVSFLPSTVDCCFEIVHVYCKHNYICPQFKQKMQSAEPAVTSMKQYEPLACCKGAAIGYDAVVMLFI